MPNQIFVFKFLVIISLGIITAGCKSPSNTQLPGVNREKVTTTILASAQPFETVIPNLQTRSATPDFIPTDTVTPTLTVTRTIVELTKNSIEATTTPISVLDFCIPNRTEICISSVRIQGDTMGITIKNVLEKMYITVDQTRYDCVLIMGYTDRIYCSGLPQFINKYAFIQVYAENSKTLLSEGRLYFPQEYIRTPTPTPTITPPNPYHW